ncbi:response regulator transcription factor [Fodinicurvata fenggangensis]|uniref:response regulator transcription factor n=1 Tax=Fodinicurvata fenggangensis TaxID=1121830 RepID=UPI001FDFD4F8|nr:response regulator transcription factor [Fodinicurvata fenggangensis]
MGSMETMQVTRNIEIAVVDDDPLFRETLSENLKEAGYSVEIFEAGEPFFEWLDNDGSPDLILLDWRMPGMNGIEVLKRMREEGHEMPVIFLTALSEQIYEEAALLSGAVDFVEKSRSFAILHKRIDLILSGNKTPQGSEVEAGDSQNQDVIRQGELELRLDSSRAFWRGERVNLSLTEFKIVHLLLQRAGQDVTYREIYDLVHGQGFLAGAGPEGYRANVRTFMKRIRQKFRELHSEFDEIENYPGFGYRWRTTER